MASPKESRSGKEEPIPVALTGSVVATAVIGSLLIHDLISLEVLGWEIFFRDLIPFVICFVLSVWLVRDYERERRSRRDKRK